MLANLDRWAQHPKLPKRAQLEAKALAARMRKTDAKRAALEKALPAAQRAERHHV